jgi:hypothetical protein
MKHCYNRQASLLSTPACAPLLKLLGGTGGCPPGWSVAVGTVYDSWPRPGSISCLEYSGCRWAGLFSTIPGGPLSTVQPVCDPSLCNTRVFEGTTYRAECLDGGNGDVACRWPESTVREWDVAATWERDASLLGSTIEVRVQGRDRTVRVNVQNVCADTDCSGCCSRNTANGAYKLIDLEKWSALELLQSFDSSAPGFDVTTLGSALPTSVGLRPGAPEGNVMPLCYRVV